MINPPHWKTFQPGCCCCCCVASVASDSLQLHRWQSTLSLGFSRQEHWSALPFPSPMHESENEVALLCLTLRDLMDCSLPIFSTNGIFQAREGCHCLLKLQWIEKDIEYIRQEVKVWEVSNGSKVKGSMALRGGRFSKFLETQRLSQMWGTSLICKQETLPE